MPENKTDKKIDDSDEFDGLETADDLEDEYRQTKRKLKARRPKKKSKKDFYEENPPVQDY